MAATVPVVPQSSTVSSGEVAERGDARLHQRRTATVLLHGVDDGLHCVRECHSRRLCARRGQTQGYVSTGDADRTIARTAPRAGIPTTDKKATRPSIDLHPPLHTRLRSADRQLRCSPSDSRWWRRAVISRSTHPLPAILSSVSAAWVETVPGNTLLDGQRLTYTVRTIHRWPAVSPRMHRLEITIPATRTV